MKIISKYKDYYDYLQGIYGIDEKLILDRRKYDSIAYYFEIIRLYIAGYYIEGIHKDGIFYYGKDLLKFKSDDRRRLYSFDSRDTTKCIRTEYGYIYIEPVKDTKNFNEVENCPILLRNNSFSNKKFYKYPILKNLKINKFISAEVMYNWLSTWLSEQISKKENQITEQTDAEKILNKGFDDKCSFRPKMKNC
jgi:hypothetical protein